MNDDSKEFEALCREYPRIPEKFFAELRCTASRVALLADCLATEGVQAEHARWLTNEEDPDDVREMQALEERLLEAVRSRIAERVKELRAMASSGGAVSATLAEKGKEFEHLKQTYRRAPARLLRAVNNVTGRLARVADTLAALEAAHDPQVQHWYRTHPGAEEALIGEVTTDDLLRLVAQHAGRRTKGLREVMARCQPRGS